MPGPEDGHTDFQPQRPGTPISNKFTLKPAAESLWELFRAHRIPTERKPFLISGNENPSRRASKFGEMTPGGEP